MYFKDLSPDLQDSLWQILIDKVKEEHRYQIESSVSPERYIQETVDDWINRHNFNLSIPEWVNQVEDADV
jgi:hypothetical protein